MSTGEQSPDEENARPLLLHVLHGGSSRRPPFWFMRQAGRYLPEYRSLRAEAGDFLELCLTPALAAEATLQPVRRYATDAAILFSDILVVPYALGQPVHFQEGIGPVLEPVRDPADLDRLDPAAAADRLAPMQQTLSLVRAQLSPSTALIGFAGAPWTVASYMVEGAASRDFAEVKRWAYGAPDSFGRLIDLLVEVTAAYLIAQARAGAQILQLFDSWIGVLPETQVRRWGIEPVQEICARVRAAEPAVPLIVFPRGAGLAYETYAALCGADALSLDTAVPLAWAARVLQPRCVVQGNLDPVLLVTGGEPMRQGARAILEQLGHGRFVFNLGHGILPQTSPEHVAALCELLRTWQP